MKNYYIFLRGTFSLLFLFMISLIGGGCVERGILEDEDVTGQKPYSQFVGKKYRLKRNCYLTRIHSNYYINICGKNGTPLELNEKYIGIDVQGGVIEGVLPKGSEFIIKKIILTYSDGGLILTRPYVEFTSNNVTANALLLVRGEPDTLVFEWRYVEMVDPEPEKK